MRLKKVSLYAILCFFCFIGTGNSKIVYNSSAKQTDYLKKNNDNDQEVDPVPSYPIADPSMALDRFGLWETDVDTMYMYYALSKNAVDYDAVLKRISENYGQLQDEFEKRDAQSQVKTQIDEAIKAAKQNRYFYFNRKLSMNPYDFDKKGFNIWGDSRSVRRVKDNKNLHFHRLVYPGLSTGENGYYGIKLTNYSDYDFIRVVDENTARKIESLRISGKYNMVFYCFARGTDDQFSKGTTLYAQIIKMIIIDDDGNEVFSK